MIIKWHDDIHDFHWSIGEVFAIIALSIQSYIIIKQIIIMHIYLIWAETTYLSKQNFKPDFIFIDPFNLNLVLIKAS